MERVSNQSSKPVVGWFNPGDLIPPHGVIRPDQVVELAEAFRDGGWDTSKPVLRGYWWDGRIQLLSGTHRQAGAKLAGIKVPVVVWEWKEVQAAWGTPDWDRIMGTGAWDGDFRVTS